MDVDAHHVEGGVASQPKATGAPINDDLKPTVAKFLSNLYRAGSTRGAAPHRALSRPAHGHASKKRDTAGQCSAL